MSELRKDPIVGRWVIIAPDRARRPHGRLQVREEPGLAAARDEPQGICPFCPGNEAKTPRDLLVLRSPDGGRWTLRVFPNKYPALTIEGGLDPEGDGLYDRQNGIGAHEVVVETPDHELHLADLSLEGVGDVLWAWRERMNDLRRDGRFRYVMVFKNQGVAAGATLPHAHSQLIALPTVPKNVSDEMQGALAYFQFKDRCVFCDIVRQETRDRVRLVHDNGEFVVVEPYAPKFPFETWIIPRRHRAAYPSCERPEYAALADALRTALRKLRQALDDPPFNFMLHTAPFREEDIPHYHWHLEIMPTLGTVAGFEWGSGFFINPTPPEEAARFLREIDA